MWSQEFLRGCAHYVGKVLHEVTWSLKHTQHFFIRSRDELESADHGQALHVIAVDLRPGDLMPGDLGTPTAHVVSETLMLLTQFITELRYCILKETFFLT